VTDLAEAPANTFTVVPRSIFAAVKPYGLHTVVIRQ